MQDAGLRRIAEKFADYKKGYRSTWKIFIKDTQLGSILLWNLFQKINSVLKSDFVGLVDSIHPHFILRFKNGSVEQMV